MAVKEHLQRLTLLVNLIKQTPYISIEDISREMEHKMYTLGYTPSTSPNTIKRDIRELREDFYIEVKYCRINMGYYIDQIMSDRMDCSGVFETFDLMNIMSSNSGSLPEFIYTEPSKPKGTKHLYDIYKAIKDNRQISFFYSKYSCSDVTRRTISPYAIKEKRGRWYVVGKLAQGEIRTFGLDRIENIVIELSKREMTDGFSMEEKFAHSYGIYSDESYPIEDVILSFDAEDGGYIKSVPLHSTQEIMVDTPEEFRISLRLRITFDFIMELLSRSNSLRIIAPESLRVKITAIYAGAIERNSSL